MVYGNSTDLGYIAIGLADDITSDFKAYCLEVADTWVNSKLSAPITGTTPDAVEKAATFWAYAFMLRSFYDTNISDSPGAMKFEAMAIELLDSYIAKSADEEAESHPYSSSLSPTHIYTERDLRTTTDDDDEIYNVSEDTWESEG
jgi:hypothetical protein